MIEINNLSKSYGINKIFENESITLTNSCIYALVGVNGIGKSTFLNSIIQPSTLDKGSVKIDDIPLPILQQNITMLLFQIQRICF